MAAGSLSPAINASSIAREDTPVEVSGDRGQFDPGVFEQLLQPLDLAGAFTGDRGAGAGQVAQLPDRLGWNERPTDQTMRAELSQPGGIGDVFSELN